MKHTLIILALITASIQTFAQSPRIKLNQITKDSITGSVLISSTTDSGMVYSRDLFISYGADTVLILGGDTLAATSSIISSVLSDGVTITGDGTIGSELTADTSVLATLRALSDSLALVISSVTADNVTITGDGTVGSPLKVDTTTVVATKGDLSDYVTIAGTQTITGTKTFSTDVEIDGKLDLNATGNSVFIGTDVGRVDDGSDNLNVGVGYQALYSNTSGNTNIALGFQALYDNTSGAANFGLGWKALNNNLTGNSNVALGNQSMLYNETGSNNIAIGSVAMGYNTSGASNTAVGYYSMFLNEAGDANTALGAQSLYVMTTGNSNVAIGYEAGRYISTGAGNTDSDNSIFIGRDSRPLADSQSNQIVIGYQGRGLGSNSVVLGNSSITKTRLQGDVGIGTDSPDYELEVTGKIYASDSIISNVYAGTSDIRLKQDIEPTDKGLDAVMELNPVSYRFIANAESEKKSYGFIAQEIEEVIPDVVGTRHDGMKVLNYNDLISVLTKAIQEQQIIIEELNQRLIKLENK